MRHFGARCAALLGAAALSLGLLAGCSGRDAELDRFIDEVKHQPGGRVEPLPEVKPYDTYAYTSSARRSPFVPGGSGAGSAMRNRPADRRNHEFLEQFSLDSLKMVGTLNLNGQNCALVRVKDGRVQRVIVGNYIGQNDGKITAISPNKISITEVVPDNLGGYLERPAELPLNE
jgi:type IV pilus assembly protein PilP